MTQICALYTEHGRRTKIAYAYYDDKTESVYIVIERDGVVIGFATSQELIRQINEHPFLEAKTGKKELFL